MRITTKVAGGFLLLIILFLVVQLYQLSLNRQTLRVNQELAQTSFYSGLQLLRLLQELDELQEFSEKFLVTADVAYGDALREMQAEFESALRNLEATKSNHYRNSDFQILLLRWARLRAAMDALGGSGAEVGGIPEESIPELRTVFEAVRQKVRGMIEAGEQSIATELAAAHARARHTETVLWVSVGLALLLAVGISFAVTQSIWRPLAKLMAATRTLEKGHFTSVVPITGDDEFSELASGFNQMVRRLRQLDELKKDFISHVSHDLKAPLASMQETTKLLLEELPGQLNDKQRRLLQLNLKSNERLAGMIRKLLDLTLLEAGVVQYNFRVCNMIEIFNTAIDEFEVLLKENHITLEKDLPTRPVWCDCDEDRLVVVLSNLIANAIRFSPPGGRLHCRLRQVDEIPACVPGWARWWLQLGASAYCQFSITDQGPGVQEEDRQQIFEKYRVAPGQASSSNRGSGLGLTISREIVKAHGGAIWVDQTGGIGSTFHFLIPSTTEAGHTEDWIEIS